MARTGVAAQAGWWLLRCGGRFSDRTQLRDYLRTGLPEYAVQVVPAAG